MGASAGPAAQTNRTLVTKGHPANSADPATLVPNAKPAARPVASVEMRATNTARSSPGRGR